MPAKLITLAVCVCFLISCGQEQPQEVKSVKPQTKVVKHAQSDSLPFVINPTDSIGVILDGVKKVYNSRKHVFHLPTNTAIDSINTSLGSNVIALDTVGNGFHLLVNDKHGLRFTYDGMSSGYYVFHNGVNVLIINSTTNERYVLALKAGYLHSKSKIQAIFYCDEKLMPIFAIKDSEGKKQPFIGFESYPYLPKSNFVVYNYGGKTKRIGSFKLSELKGVMQTTVTKPIADTIVLRHYGMFIDWPLWDDSGGYYIFSKSNNFFN